MSALDFIRSNARWLGAGAVLTFSSCFGQTFFIALFAGEIRAEFGLSDGEWGGIYTLGTLGSAVMMLWSGTLTDRFRTKHLGVVVLLIMAAMCLAMAVNPWAGMLPLIIFGLRNSGQGMLSHMAVVAMGRWFVANRGKAVALAATGYLVGESLLPILFVALKETIGWRVSWGIAAILPILAIPLLLFLLRQERSPRSPVKEGETSLGMNGIHWTRTMALKHWLFWMVAPAMLCSPIFGTAFFFQQVHLTETKGWDHTAFVALFPIYVVVSISSIYVAGWLIDRIGTSKVVGFFLIPMALAFLVLGQGETMNAALLGFIFVGISSGTYNAVAGVFWPEFYGTHNLGSIRAVATSLSVFGSAVGPGVTGYLIDFGINFEDQMIGIAIISLVSAALAALAMRWARPLLAATA